MIDRWSVFLYGCADVCGCADVYGCADVCVTAGRGPGAGGMGLSGLGQRCGELSANSD